MRLRVVFVVLCVVLLAHAIANAQAATEIDTAFAAAHEADAPLRSLVHLWLRIAGGVWIAVEWIAAVFLIRGFYALRRAIERDADFAA